MNTRSGKLSYRLNSSWLTLMLASLMVLILQSAQAALYLTESFNYTAGALGVSPANGTWDTTARSAINVTATGLTGPTGFPASSGNDVTIGNTGHNQQNFNTFASSGTIVSGTVYACFLLKVTSSGSMRSADTTTSPNYNDAFTLALQNATSPASPFCSVRLINSSGIKIGLAKDGGAGTYRSTALTANTTYMVVVKYDFSTTPNTASFWILSTYSGTEAGAGAADVTINTGSDLAPGAAGLGQCYLSDAAGGTFQVDELRIGSTWQDVTGGAPAGPAAKLAFTTQPANAAPGATMSAVVVQAQDAGGLAVATNNVPVTLTLTAGSGTLSGTLTQNTDASGKATFSNLSINTAGTGKQLTAAASGIGAGLSSVVSSNFSIVAPSVGVKLGFTTQPPVATLVNATMGAVVVQVQDVNGVSIASNNVPITMALSAGSGTLSGTLTQNSDATGKATFGDLSINTVGVGDQFTASASGIGTGLTNAVSSTFSITNGVTPPPSTNGPLITQILLIPEGVVLSGVNGAPGSNYNVLTSSDVSQTATNWVPSTYANYDANGNFIITNPAPSILAGQFYRLATTVNTKLTPPSINQSPGSLTVAVGQTATFTVVASGPQLIYQWYFAGNPLPGQRSSTLTINNCQAGNAGSYYVIVANGAGAASSATATLRVGNYAPTITLQPVGQTNYVGGTTIFRALADGTQPLAYQWYHNDISTPVTGATNATLTLNNLQPGDAGTYFVVVTGAVAPAATSGSASLGVNTAPAALPYTNVVGFAALAGVTGGAAGTNVYTGDYLTFSNYVRHTEALIINVTNLIQGPGPAVDSYCYVYGNNKTIIGIGTNAGLAGIDLRINATNIIVQNLFLPVTPIGTNDGITIDGGTKGTGKYIWIDHCTVSNAQDGSIDITKGADYVTLSWCKFEYAPKTPNFTHELVDLIGSSDSDFVNNNPFHVTIHHCWYADNAIERMPSVRHGLVHVFNCYYTCSGNNYCVRTRIGSEVLVENTFFSGVQNPWELLTTTGTTGLLRAVGNNVTGPGDTSNGNTWANGWYPGQSLIPGTDTLSNLMPIPYVYVNALDTAADAAFYVPTYAGNGKYPYAP